MYTAKIIASISEAPSELFANISSPFLSAAFWQALEDSGAISPKYGWQAQHILLFDETNQAVALMPLFAKNHNRGEYVFDHGWAQAYQDNGLHYYPRLVSCVPFTPVLGQRVWLTADIDLNTVLPFLLDAVRQLAEQLNASSWHGLFIQASDILEFAQTKPALAIRYNCQFLWKNDKYTDFDGFLATMSAKKRKNIKAERAKISRMGIVCEFIEGDLIKQADWAFFYACYERTYHVRGQMPYLNLAFFEQLGHTMSEHLVLEIARTSDGERIAAALFFKDAHTLYGRYWGALLDVDCLHFEVCYYQGIDYALRNQLNYFDPGTQGEHKLMRGFAPVLTQSAHWLADERFMRAVHDFVQREKISVQAYFDSATEALPFKKSTELNQTQSIKHQSYNQGPAT